MAQKANNTQSERRDTGSRRTSGTERARNAAAMKTQAADPKKAGGTEKQNTSVQRTRTSSKKAALRKRQQKILLYKEIFMVVVFGFAVMMFVSFFVDSMEWLDSFAYRIFGVLKYIAPFLLTGLVWVILFLDGSPILFRRILSLLLTLFAALGIITIALTLPDGGLIGKGNYALFHKALGDIGMFIVNVVLIAVALLLFSDFSVSDWLKKRAADDEKKREENREIRDKNHEIRQELKEQQKTNKALDKQKTIQDNLETARREARLKKQAVEEQNRRLKNESGRFATVTGITDTTLTDIPVQANQHFYDANESVVNKDKLFGKYANSGSVENSAKEKLTTDPSFIPTINVPKEYFTSLERKDDREADEIEVEELNLSDLRKVLEKAEKEEYREDDPDNVIPVFDTGKQDQTDKEDVKRMENAVNQATRFFEEKKPEDKKAPEQYQKTVITANGKIITTETDGDILSKKTVIHAGESRETAPEQKTAPDDSSEDLEKLLESSGLERSYGLKGGENTGKQTVSSTVPETSSDSRENAKLQEEENRKTAGSIEASLQEEEKKDYRFPPVRLLKKGAGSSLSRSEIQAEIRETASKLQETLKTFGVGVRIQNISCGPTVTRYEIQPELGVKVSKIVSLKDDIALNLAAADIRMEAPIPGKSAIGIEIPNKVKQGVAFRDILESQEFQEAKSKLAFTVGRDIEGNVIIADIAKMPHVLVAGATGSGKSVCINTMIMSIIYHALPTEVKMIMVDPKVVELSVYNGIPHLLLPVVTDPKKAAAALNWAVVEMENRYQSFAEYGVRGIEGFNDMVEREAPEAMDGTPVRKMPQILIIVDELADLMMVAPKDVEDAICRLAQKARAAGIHLVLATQRPSVDVITGLIKANIPSRIAFAVSSGIDSRTILDTNGAESLLGAGDMLYAPSGSNKPIRVQGSFVTDSEVNAVVDYVKNQGEVKGGSLQSIELSSGSASAVNGGSEYDEYFADAGRLVIEKQKASIGMLQRAFKIGFNRAARIVDQLYEAGVVGEEEGTKPRRVLMTPAEFEESLKQ